MPDATRNSIIRWGVIGCAVDLHDDFGAEAWTGVSRDALALLQQVDYYASLRAAASHLRLETITYQVLACPAIHRTMSDALLKRIEPAHFNLFDPEAFLRVRIPLDSALY